MTFYGHQNRIGRQRNKKPECGQKESLAIKRVAEKGVGDFFKGGNETIGGTWKGINGEMRVEMGKEKTLICGTESAIMSLKGWECIRICTQVAHSLKPFCSLQHFTGFISPTVSLLFQLVFSWPLHFPFPY